MTLTKKQRIKHKEKQAINVIWSEKKFHKVKLKMLKRLQEATTTKTTTEEPSRTFNSLRGKYFLVFWFLLF